MAAADSVAAADSAANTSVPSGPGLPQNSKRSSSAAIRSAGILKNCRDFPAVSFVAGDDLCAERADYRFTAGISA